MSLIKIDEFNRSDHPHLTQEDDCYFLHEYTARAGFTHSDTNSLIMNFKKGLEYRRTYAWRYKQMAINQIGQMLREVLTDDLLRQSTLVPIPPSKCKSDPHYDDRIIQVLNICANGVVADVRELLYCTENYRSSHGTEERLGPAELRGIMEVNQELLTEREVTNIILVDDIITTGAHFRACKELLNDITPNTSISGVFVARRVFLEA